MGQTAWESLRVPAVKLGSISTSPQEECPVPVVTAGSGCGPRPPRAVPTDPPALLGTHSAARRVPGAWWCAGSRREQMCVPRGGCAHRGPRRAYMASGQQREPGVRRAGLGGVAGWAGRCSGQGSPLSARQCGGRPVGGSRGSHGSKTWPEMVASGSFF